MKKLVMFGGVALVMLATLHGCKSTPEISALVKGKECKVVALDLEYEAAIDPASVSIESFVVEGEEIVFAKVTEPEHVLIVLKRECKGDGQGCMKQGECGKGECEKGECENGECDKGESDKAKTESEKSACEKGGCENGGCEKTACKKEETKCDKAKSDCKIAKCFKAKTDDGVVIPDIRVKQIADIKTLDGKTLKAWSSARKATDVEFIGRGKGKCKGSCDDCD